MAIIFSWMPLIEFLARFSANSVKRVSIEELVEVKLESNLCI